MVTRINPSIDDLHVLALRDLNPILAKVPSYSPSLPQFASHPNFHPPPPILIFEG